MTQVKNTPLPAAHYMDEAEYCNCKNSAIR